MAFTIVFKTVVFFALTFAMMMIATIQEQFVSIAATHALALRSAHTANPKTFTVIF